MASGWGSRSRASSPWLTHNGTADLVKVTNGGATPAWHRHRLQPSDRPANTDNPQGRRRAFQVETEHGGGDERFTCTCRINGQVLQVNVQTATHNTKHIVAAEVVTSSLSYGLAFIPLRSPRGRKGRPKGQEVWVRYGEFVVDETAALSPTSSARSFTGYVLRVRTFTDPDDMVGVMADVSIAGSRSRVLSNRG